MSDFPAAAPISRIAERLPLIFPEGVQRRNYLIREIAAKTVFVALYAGALEGHDRWIRPNQVTRMTDAQAVRLDDTARKAWAQSSLKRGTRPAVGCWYEVDTREPIRDETIRYGLVEVGAIVEKPGLPVTSDKPRYALTADFARLLTCETADFEKLAAEWRQRHLTAAALARLTLLRRGTVAGFGGDKVLVRFPNGEGRQMSPGPSSQISKAVIEVFAIRFLRKPGVVFLSESREKVIKRDDELAKALHLNIAAAEVLPDIILVDLGPQTPLLVFIEVVASDGPVSERRRMDLLKVATDGGYTADNVAFVTALLDQSEHGTFKKVAADIAWGSFVWFSSEPEHLVHYRGTLPGTIFLSDILTP